MRLPGMLRPRTEALRLPRVHVVREVARGSFVTAVERYESAALSTWAESASVAPLPAHEDEEVA